MPVASDSVNSSILEISSTNLRLDIDVFQNQVLNLEKSVVWLF